MEPRRVLLAKVPEAAPFMDAPIKAARLTDTVVAGVSGPPLTPAHHHAPRRISTLSIAASMRLPVPASAVSTSKRIVWPA